MEIKDRLQKFYAGNDRSISIHAVRGHFATSQSHINYFIDLQSIKSRAKEAKEAADVLSNKIMSYISTVDTIVCLDGTQVVGAFLADELEKKNIGMTNAHETIYVVEPEFNSVGNFLFRQSVRPSIGGKNCLLLTASLTTGETAAKALATIEYYGGKAIGVASLFSTTEELSGKKVISIFDQEDLPGYATYPQIECPMCKNKERIEAMVNSYGYSQL